MFPFDPGGEVSVAKSTGNSTLALQFPFDPGGHSVSHFPFDSGRLNSMNLSRLQSESTVSILSVEGFRLTWLR